jgi:tetratricopeptide (TPR) repeat protein
MINKTMITSIIYIFLVAAILTLGCSNPTEFMTKGDNYYAQKQWDNAIAEYAQILKLDPKQDYNASYRDEAYYKIGNANYNNGKYGVAVINYGMAIESGKVRNPKAEAYAGRAFALMGPYKIVAMGAYNNSINDFNMAILINPKCIDAYTGRGLANFAQGDYPKAIADYTKVMAIDPKYTEVFYNQGLLYSQIFTYGPGTMASQMGRQTGVSYDNEAVDGITTVIEANPTYAKNYNTRGAAYLIKGDYNKAIADFTQSLNLNPTQTIPYAGRGIAYFAQGNYPKTIGEYTKALEQDPNDVWAYMIRGIAWQKSGGSSQAETDFKKATELGWKGKQ